MTELITDKQTWSRIAMTIGSLLIVMVVAIAISVAIG